MWKKRSFLKVLIPVVLAGFLFSCAGAFVSPAARADFEAGLALFNQGKFAEALPYFERAAAAEPDYYEAHLYLGRAYLNMKSFAKAVPPLRTAYRLSPQDFKGQIVDILIDALLGAAFSEVRTGNYEGSLSYLRELMSVEPKAKKVKEDISNVLVAVATSLLMKGDVRDAVKLFGEAVTENPNNAKAYLGLARALLKTGAIPDAIDAGRKALSLDPASNEAFNLMKEMVR
ncbi:MAG TPA: tetratricopeptide repeat protein [Syntrophorhabdaceae bacterium]|nr:tetratricopeptide repeat protein [Syntrophorhabdaceae bacterium]HOD75840.1 tetratricopeptide repeat protein [Syntrophorhabdaceae bacterium]